MGFSDVTATVRPNLARPGSRGTNIVDLGGAVHCAWVLRDSLVVGDTKRRLRNEAGSLGSGLIDRAKRYLSECITIIALVGNKRLGVWQHWIDQSRALMVTHLSFCEKKDNWPAGAIANRVQLGVQPAFRAANETG
jgi:hypothetical protein